VSLTPGASTATFSVEPDVVSVEAPPPSSSLEHADARSANPTTTAATTESRDLDLFLTCPPFRRQPPASGDALPTDLPDFRGATILSPEAHV
jgi:hypothetical protein